MFQKKRKFNPGFSLIEIMVVLGMISILAAASFLNVSKKRNMIILEDAQANLVTALEKARSNSQAGIGTLPHGVRIESNKFTVFEGNPAEGKTTVFPSSILTNQSIPLNIIFHRISGTSNASTIIIKNPSNGTEKIINIFQDGRITTP